MSLWRDPRVLYDDWTPPQFLGRAPTLRTLQGVRPVPFHPHPRAVVVLHGPRGAGTSALAGAFLRELQTAWSAVPRRPLPLFLRVDVSATRTPGATISELFHQLDPTTSTRGASSEQLTLLFLRRLRTLGRPTLLWFDQVRRTSTELSRVLLPICRASGFLPEGSGGLPLLAMAVSGECDPLAEVPSDGPSSDGPLVRERLPPLSRAEIREALEVRVRLAFNVPPSEATLHRLEDTLAAQGAGLSLAGELLRSCARRAELRGGDRLLPEDVELLPSRAGEPRRAREFDACLLETLREAATSAVAPRLSLRDLRGPLEEKCRESGLARPTQARLWRHLVALEDAGALHREVRMGGTGGTRTFLLLDPPGGMASVEPRSAGPLPPAAPPPLRAPPRLSAGPKALRTVRPGRPPSPFDGPRAPWPTGAGSEEGLLRGRPRRA